jgi:hypothetical protein
VPHLSCRETRPQHPARLPNLGIEHFFDVSHRLLSRFSNH